MRHRLLPLVGILIVGTLTLWIGLAPNDSGEPTDTGAPGNTPAARDLSARFADFQPAPEPNGDLRKVDWPGYVIDAGPEVKRLYEYQITNGELMRYMPCFCGCQWEDGHRNNRDCYVERVNADGSVVLDPMAPT
jgi:hypothetical protein